ncbi:hypothetical protein F5Y08DRAFT_347435 [Xylaria arbuscula]|nr:hypothetical protein F5Y08DRAFT_347435 [Xylaria arbuscula]
MPPTKPDDQSQLASHPSTDSDDTLSSSTEEEDDERGCESRFLLKMKANGMLYSIFDQRWMKYIYHVRFVRANEFIISYRGNKCVRVVNPSGRIVYERGNPYIDNSNQSQDH